MGERELWCAVIDQAVSDALFRPSLKRVSNEMLLRAARRLVFFGRTEEEITEMKKKKTVPTIKERINNMMRDNPKAVNELARKIALNAITRERNQAREWLTSDSHDFREVCSLAGMEHDAVLDRMRALAARDWQMDEHTRQKVRRFREGT